MSGPDSRLGSGLVDRAIAGLANYSKWDDNAKYSLAYLLMGKFGIEMPAPSTDWLQSAFTPPGTPPPRLGAGSPVRAFADDELSVAIVFAALFSARCREAVVGCARAVMATTNDADTAATDFESTCKFVEAFAARAADPTVGMPTMPASVGRLLVGDAGIAGETAAAGLVREFNQTVAGMELHDWIVLLATGCEFPVPSRLCSGIELAAMLAVVRLAEHHPGADWQRASDWLLISIGNGFIDPVNALLVLRAADFQRFTIMPNGHGLFKGLYGLDDVARHLTPVAREFVPTYGK